MCSNNCFVGKVVVDRGNEGSTDTDCFSDSPALQKKVVLFNIFVHVWKRSTTYIVCSQLKVYYIRGGWHSAVNRGSCPLNRRRGIGQER